MRFEIGIIRLPLDDRCPDSCFVEDTVVVFDNMAILTCSAHAIASRLPSLRLVASLEPFAMVDDLVRWGLRQLGGLISTSLVGGEQDASVLLARERSQEALFTYGQVLLVALWEARAALRHYEHLRAQLALREEQRVLAQDASKLAQNLYLDEDVEILEVYAAEKRRQQAEVDWLEARKHWLAAHIQLCRALASSWTPAGSS